MLHKQRGSWLAEHSRMIAIAATVVALALAITLGVYFAALAAERKSAAVAFTSSSEDLATQLLHDNLAHARDYRIVSERVGRATENAGALPSRSAYAQHCKPFRINPNRVFTGLTMVVNVSAAERDRFEAALTAENGMPKTLLTPEGGPVAAADWYATNAYINTPADALRGYDKLRPGLCLSSDAHLRDTMLRASRSGRLLGTSPLALRECFAIKSKP